MLVRPCWRRRWQSSRSLVPTPYDSNRSTPPSRVMCGGRDPSCGLACDSRPRESGRCAGLAERMRDWQVDHHLCSMPGLLEQGAISCLPAHPLLASRLLRGDWHVVSAHTPSGPSLRPGLEDLA